jgi:FkbM family methyltransferase
MTATKLNLGSGESPLAGYDNRDIRTGQQVYPLPDPDGSVEEVRASHVLEHFPHGEVEAVVKEWARVIKPGGRLRLAVPDFDWIVRNYQNGRHPDLESFLYGGQLDANDFHKSMFNEEKLKGLLEGAGLVDVARWRSETNDCASYPLSLNLEAVKPKLIHVAEYEFIKDSKGIIHVGANTGQERDIYAQAGLPVVWIEALQSQFRLLCENIAGCKNQRALNYLIADSDDKSTLFHIANNDGQSSSIFELGDHRKLWPEIDYAQETWENALTLKTVLQRHAVNLDEYDTLIIDVQGAELLVLKGAGDALDKFRFIRAETSDFELYKGGSRLKDLDEYLIPRGFNRVTTWQYKRSRDHATDFIYEALYEKKAARRVEIAPIYIEDPQSGAKAMYRVAALASVPRLGFQAHMGASEQAFADPRIPILRESGCVFWEMTMQNGFNSLIRAGADYIITTDYDSIFTNADVKELLRLIVRYPDADAIAAWQASRWKNHAALAGIKTQNGQWGGGVPLDDMKRLDLTRVDNTVYGLTIIKTSAILKIPKPWFMNVPNADGEWEHGKHDADSYFWHKFIEAGNALYMANRVRVGHLHEDVLWVDDDFQLIKQDLTDYYSKGRPF